MEMTREEQFLRIKENIRKRVREMKENDPDPFHALQIISNMTEEEKQQDEEYAIKITQEVRTQSFHFS